VSGLLLYTGIAAEFGATVSTDAFFLALTIPMLFIGPVLATASATLIPALTECRVKRPERVGAIVGSALVWAVATSGAAAVIIGLLAPVGLAATSRALTREMQALVLRDIVLLLPFLVSQVAATVLSMASNAAGCFWLPPSAAIVRQVATIGAIVALSGPMGVLALPVGLTLGSIAQLMCLAAFWRQAATPLRIGWQLDPELRRSLRLAVPLLLGTALLHLGIVAFRFLAASLPPGSVTSLDYATRIYTAIGDLVGSGVLLVTLTDWAAIHARGDIEELQRRVRRTVTLTLFALVPVVVALYAAREPLIGLWLGRTEMDAALRDATAVTLGYLALGLPLEMVGRIYSQLLVVRRAPWILAAIAAVRVGVTVALATRLSPSLGVPGFGLAETLGLVVAATALAIAARRLAGHSLQGTVSAAGRLAVAGVGAWLAAYGAAGVLSGQTNVVLLVTVSATALIAYLGLAWAFRAPELRTVIGYALGRRAVAH
jgi:putative peptidoglycan lipid II flippase